MPDSTSITPEFAEVIDLPDNQEDALTLRTATTREGKLWLLATLAMAAIGLFKGINLLVLMAYLLIGLLILNWWIAPRNLRRLHGRRISGEPLFARVAGTRHVEVYCEVGAPARGWILDDRGDGFHLDWQILHLYPGHILKLHRALTLARRGKHRVEPLLASSRYPFGLVQASIQLSGPEELIVLPRLGKLHREHLKQWLGQSIRGDGRAHRRVRHSSPHEADLHGLREFRSGDSPRWIHWKTSARRNQLLVREFEDDAPAHLMLIVEPWLPYDATLKQRHRLEHLISIAATICREWCRESAGRLILVLARPEPLVLDGVTGPDLALRTMEALALEMGSPTVPVSSWIGKLSRSASSVPMLAISSGNPSTLVDAIRFEIGRPVASVDIAEAIGWYEPPLS